MSSDFSSDVAQVAPHESRHAAPSTANLPQLDEGTANSDVRALFAQYRERFARTDLAGILRCFATNPALLKGVLEITENFVFWESLFGRRHKEMITTFVFTSKSEFDPFRSRFYA